jgi:hypothetical protein
MVIADGDAKLTSLKAEAGTQFEQKTLQVVQQGLFQIAFVKIRAVSQAGEFKHVRVADQVFNHLSRLLLMSARDDLLFISGKPDALEQPRPDLASKLAFRPLRYCPA